MRRNDSKRPAEEAEGKTPSVQCAANWLTLCIKKWVCTETNRGCKKLKLK
jgi:hypothetical protein